MKTSLPNSVKIRNIITEFGSDAFCELDDNLFCKFCHHPVKFDKRFHVQQHFRSLKHQKAAAFTLRNHQTSNSAGDESSRAIASSSQASNSQNLASEDFKVDLTKMMVLCEIPLWKLENKCFKS